MAGSSQAVNLGGMLSQIGTTIGSMGESAGEKLSENILNMGRPDVDMNDAASVERYAQWARDTGKEAEALAYTEKASTMKKERQAAEAIGNSVNMTQMAGQAAIGGDVAGVQHQIAEAARMSKEAAAAGNYEAATTYGEQAVALQTTAKEAKAVQSDNHATGVLQMNDMIEAGGFQGPDGQFKAFEPGQKEALEKNVKQMMSNPSTMAKANQLVLQKAQVKDAQRNQVKDAETAKFLGATAGAKTVADLDKAYENVPDEFKPDVINIREFQASAIERRDEATAKAAANNTPVASADRVQGLQDSIDALPEGSAITPMVQSLLDKAKSNDDNLYKNGTYAAGTRRTAEAAFNVVENKILQLVGGSLAQTDSHNRTLEAQNANSILQAKLDAVSPLTATDMDSIRRMAEANDTDIETETAAFRRQQFKGFMDLQKQLDPEGHAKWLSEMPISHFTPDQMKTWTSVVLPTYPELAEADPLVVEEVIASLQSEGKWPAGGDYPDDTTPQSQVTNGGGITDRGYLGMLKSMLPRGKAKSEPNSGYIGVIQDIWSAAGNPEEE